MGWVVTAWSHETRSPEILYQGGSFEKALSELHLAQQFEGSLLRGKLYKNVRMVSENEFLKELTERIQAAIDEADFPPE